MDNRETYSVPALERGLDLVEALADASEPLSLAELAQAVGRSSSSIFRMINCLERRGYVLKDVASGKYTLSLRFFSIAHSVRPLERLMQVARPEMRVFAEKLNVSCHLSVLDRHRLVVVAQEEGAAKVRLSIDVGGVFDPVATASGLLLLSQLEEWELQSTVAHSATFESASSRERARLGEELKDIRAKNFSKAQDQTVVGVRDWSVPVGGSQVGIRAALTVSFFARKQEKLSEKKLLEAMRETAKRINQKMGVV